MSESFEAHERARQSGQKREQARKEATDAVAARNAEATKKARKVRAKQDKMRADMRKTDER